MQSIHVVGAAIVEGGRCLAALRGPSMQMAGKWEFPGGKVERGEPAKRALARELREELNLEAFVGDWLGRGDFIEEGRRVCLDVYLCEADTRPLILHEHAEVKWIDPGELYALDWAAADVPILPALHGYLTGAGSLQCIDHPVTLLAADWGKERRKRAVYSAEFNGVWRLRRRTHPSGWSVAGLLDVAEEIRAQSQSSVLIGIDVSLGLPTALLRDCGERNFESFLQTLARTDGFERESSSAAQWRIEKPFFRIPSGKGGKEAFFEAAGGQSRLLRQIEIRSRANPTFALSGIPGTVGSGTREVWRELVQTTSNYSLWPFAGSLAELVARRDIIIGEIYPRAAYGLALADSIPAKAERIAKTRREAREATLARLARSNWVLATGTQLPDLAAARDSEDDFDALLSVAAMTRAVAEGISLSCNLVDPIAEGGVLATGCVRLPPVPW